MADFIAQVGGTDAAPAATTTVNPCQQSRSEQVFTGIALLGAVAGAAGSTALGSAYPASIGILTTVLGSGVATFAWYLTQSFWSGGSPHA